MHNSHEINREFQLQWCKTNLFFLLGANDPLDPEVARKISFMQSEIARLEKPETTETTE